MHSKEYITKVLNDGDKVLSKFIRNSSASPYDLAEALAKALFILEEVLYNYDKNSSNL